MSVIEVCKLDGFNDLPSIVKLPFAKAWLAEQAGNTAEAVALLDKAVAAEAALKAKS